MSTNSNSWNAESVNSASAARQDLLVGTLFTVGATGISLNLLLEMTPITASVDAAL